MWAETRNPPLVSYLIAAVGGLAGWEEMAMHAGFLVPALAVVLGTWRLASLLSPRPLFAALATLATPLFLVSGTGIMCDVPMLACFVWAIVLWRSGIERDAPLPLLGAGLLAAAAALAKYFAAALVPLLLLDALARRRRPGWWCAALLLPVGALWGYELWTRALYGHGLLSDAAGFAQSARFLWHWTPAAGALSSLAFAGGLTLLPLFLAGRCFAARVVWPCALIVVLATFGVVRGGIWEGVALPGWWNSGAVAAHAALFVPGGLLVAALALSELWRRRDPDALLLAGWVLGTLAFTAFVNWTVNARSLLPLAPAVAILLARRVEAASGRARALEWTAFATTFFVAFSLAAADERLANDQRAAARYIVRRYAAGDGALWFQGHWGFQYYMEEGGARPLDVLEGIPRTGDFVAFPENNTGVLPLREDRSKRIETILLDALPLSTTRPGRGAGFYSHWLGPLPWALGGDQEEFYVYRLSFPKT